MRVRLLSAIGGTTVTYPCGSVIDLPAHVAAAWIADGLARAEAEAETATAVTPVEVAVSRGKGRRG